MGLVGEKKKYKHINSSRGRLIGLVGPIFRMGRKKVGEAENIWGSKDLIG